jgi:hypothetical protein
VWPSLRLPASADALLSPGCTFKNFFSRSSRGNEAQISLETIIIQSLLTPSATSLTDGQRGGSVTTNSQNDSMQRTTSRNCLKSTGLVM